MVVMPTAALRAAWALGVVSVTTVAALASEAPKLDSFWSTSGMTYVLGLLTIVNLVGLILHRMNTPNEKAIEAAKREAAKAAADVARDAERRFQQIAEDLKAAIERVEERMAEDRTALADHDVRIRKNTEDHVQSREDRRHQAQDTADLKSTIERWRQEDRQRDKETQQSVGRVLEALVQLRGGKPGVY